MVVSGGPPRQPSAEGKSGRGLRLAFYLRLSVFHPVTAFAATDRETLPHPGDPTVDLGTPSHWLLTRAYLGGVPQLVADSCSATKLFTCAKVAEDKSGNVKRNDCDHRVTHRNHRANTAGVNRSGTAKPYRCGRTHQT